MSVEKDMKVFNKAFRKNLSKGVDKGWDRNSPLPGKEWVPIDQELGLKRAPRPKGRRK